MPKKEKTIKEIALRTIGEEEEAISALKGRINKDFTEAVNRILQTRGRVIVTGIGKSAIVGLKLVASLNSTGTPSVFMHAADAIHGDLGMIQSEDVIICISKSGETPEIRILVPLLKSYGSSLIAMVGNLRSYLAMQADLVLDTTVDKEACPNNLAPTSSTTAQIVMGDALAVCLLERRGFTTRDFAKLHPGGALGKKLYLKVSDLYINNLAPAVKITDGVKTIIVEISSKRLGATAVLDGKKLKGIITDGDLRRMLEKNIDYRSITAGDVMTANPKTTSPETMVVDALSLMRQNNITHLLVVDKNRYLGVLHLHDILKEGII